MTALVHRYGPHGSFWSANPQIPARPIRMWQIWNEENLSYYWQQPFASSYISLLRAAHNAIKRADPGAKVIVGALTNMAWTALGQLYRHGARKLFDAVAVNGFTKKPANVILYLRLVRRAMDRFKDRRKPLYATEVSWPSAVGDTKVHFDWDTTEAGQARNIAALLPMLGADRFSLGLQGFYYYNWMGVEDFGAPDFSFAGLVGITDRWPGVHQAGPGRLPTRRAGARALQGEVLGGHPLRQALSCRRRPEREPRLTRPGTGRSGPPRTGPPADRPPTRPRRRSDRPRSGC